LYEIEFKNSSFGDNATYIWDFGDGEISYEKEPKHTYFVDGFYNEIYDVKLKIKDDEGNTVTKIKALTIKGSTNYDCFTLPHLNFFVKEDGTIVFSNDYKNISVLIYSIDGRLVKDVIIDTKNKEYKVRNGRLVKGLYSIVISNESEFHSDKFIVK
jgi:PKD repeat protein